MQGGDDPVTRPALLHSNVKDLHDAASVIHCDFTVEKLGDDKRFNGALVEGADIEQAGRNDGTGFNCCHTSKGQKHAFSGANLDDEANDIGGRI